MVERLFDEEMDLINKQLLEMAAMTEEAICKSVEALKNRDKTLANKIIQDDEKIDKLELEIEERAVDLLALRQPMAKDLRFIITTGIKINAELERIADLAVNICQRSLSIMDHDLVKPLIDIPKLSEIARKMVKDVIDAFVNRDEALAKQVILTDPQADALRNRITDELVNDFMVKDGTTAPRAVPLILVARHLERICDHAAYIAADIIYMVHAKVVKHNPQELDKIE